MTQTHRDIKRQAARIDCLMPTVLRRICTLDGPRVDLPVAQLRLCALLMQGPMTMSVLSRELGTTLSATTQLADRLQALGLVERVAEAADRRSRSLRLTVHGSELMVESREQRLERWVEVLSLLRASSRTTLLSVLDELVAACYALPREDGPQEALAGRAAEILLQVERSS